jgi:hypothetical protein
MASIITATTTSGLTQSADNSGVLQLASGTGNLVTVPSVTGTLITSSISSSSTGSGTANSIASNTYTNIVSSLSLPNNSLIIAYFNVTTSGGNSPSQPTYGCYISTASNSSGIVAGSNSVGPYPQSGISNLQATIMYFNRTGSSQSIWLAGQPYAGSNYNTPNYTATYYIVSFS